MELYYYTTTDTMRFILENGDIYATNIRYMNDSEEYTNGLDALWKLANNEEFINWWFQECARKDISTEDIKKVFTEQNLKKNQQDMEYYSISFCEINDLLSQWAIYAKESGVSLKMDFIEEKYSFVTESTEKKERARWGLFPQKVFYFTYDLTQISKKEYRDKAYEIFERLYNSKDPVEEKNENWKYVSTFIKRWDFYQEAERRLVFQPGQPPYPPKIQYRMDKKVLKPYIDVECENGWPVLEIMVGPGFNQQVVYDSVIHFLEHVQVKNGIENTTQYISRIQKYFEPWHKDLCQYDVYRELDRYCADRDMIGHMRLEDARCIFVQQIKNVCREVCSSGESDLRTYIETHYFAGCGTIVSKSSIPYIF